MSDEADITKKIQETKRQTEALKTQLQNLIDEGKNLVCPSQSKLNLLTSKDEEEPVKSPNKLQIIKSFDNKHSMSKSGKPDIPKKTANPDSPKKIRTYDVKETREYMKKQKEKRLEQSKNQNEAKIKAEIQKKKLQELHKKSLELLAKNVQAKRERSKSRDREMYVRPYDAANLVTNLRRAKSIDNINSAGTLLQKNPNLLYPPSPEWKNKSKHGTSNTIDPIRQEPEKIVILARNFTRRGINHEEERREPVTTTVRHTNRVIPEPKQNKNSHIKQIENKTQSDGKVKSTVTTNTTTNKNKYLELIAFDHLKPRRLFDNAKEIGDNVQVAKTSVDSIKNILEYKSSSHSNISLKSPVIEDEKVDKKINAARGDNTIPTVKKTPMDNIVKNKPVDDIVNNKPVEEKIKQSKEIQTEVFKKEYPKWLQEQPPQAYPFNFINTITRKLQLATNKQKTTTDIGIQNSLVLTNPRENDDILATSKSREDCKRDLQSFVSHNRLNLDPAPLEQLELVPKKTYDIARKLSSHKSTQITETESESDTSKNIPEISSESGTSLKKNKESVRKALMTDSNLAISTEKIDSMKLVVPSVATTTNIRSETHIPSDSKLTKSTNNVNKKDGNTLSVNNPYASDFDSDGDISSEEGLNRSRRSIISFNRSGYNKVVIRNSESIGNVSLNRSDDRNDLSPHKSLSSINTDMLLDDNSINASFEKSEKNELAGLSLKNKKSRNNENKNADNIKSVDIQQSVSSLSKSDHTLDLQKVDKSEHFKLNNKVCNISNTNNNSLKHTDTHNIVTSSKDGSIGTEIQPSGSLSTNLSKSDVSYQNINTQRGSTSSENLSKSEISYRNINTQRGNKNSDKGEILPVLPVVESTVSSGKNIKGQQQEVDGNRHIVKNLSVHSSKISTVKTGNDANQIHLKFEAEIHLLNDFNESLRKFSALEQALETLKTKNTITTSKILQNNNSKTSLAARTSKTTKIGENVQPKRSQSQLSQINFSRGSFISTSIDDDLNLLENSALDKDNTSFVSTGLEISNLNSINQSLSVKSEGHLSNFENLQSVNFAGLSLNMFEQLIKDEDTRLENLKTILKIREQALLDRTKGELAWLEIQRKHFKETGKLHEASVIKKKQRGILVNHQKEKHEMQRLKQMQKAASIERKIVLKEQRNLIRRQLSTDNMLTKMKVNTPREKRLSGPLKVLQSHTESIRSETSITKRSSSEKEKDVLSITSHHSTTHHSIVSEISEVEVSSKDMPSMEHQKYIKRTLLMREEALKKRRKAAEELLQWHKKLLEEEKRIAILESTASAIISQKPSTSKPKEKFMFKGKQLNQLWFNLTRHEGKKFVDDKIYPMSQLALERFCKSAREYSHKTKTLLKKSSETDVSVSENILSSKISSEKDYVSDFENESAIASGDLDVVDQSIDILINNFNQIQDDISTLNIIQSRKSDESQTEDVISDKFDKSESEAEISVIETNRTKSVLISEKIKGSSSSIDSNKQTIDDNVSGIENNSSGKLKSDSISEQLLSKVTQDTPEVIVSEEIKSHSVSQKSLLEETSKTVIAAASKDKESKTDTESDNSSKLKLVVPDISITDQAVSDTKNSSNESASGVILTTSAATKESSGDESIINDQNVVFENSENKDASSKINQLVAEPSPNSTQKSHSDVLSEIEQESKKSSSLKDESNLDGDTKEVDVKNSISENLENVNLSNENVPIIEDILNTQNNSQKSDILSEKSSRMSNYKQTIDDAIPTILSDQTSSLKSSLDEKSETAQESLKESKSDSHISVEKEASEGDVEEQIKDLNVTAETKESLNESQDVVLIPGETEIKCSSDEEKLKFQLKDSLSESEEILSKLSQIITQAKELDEKEQIPPKKDEFSVKEKEHSNEIEAESPKAEEVVGETVELSVSSTKAISETDSITSKNEDNEKSETDLTGSPIKTTDSDQLSKPDEDVMSQSLLKLFEISKLDRRSCGEESGESSKLSSDVLPDISELEHFINNELGQIEKVLPTEVSEDANINEVLDKSESDGIKDINESITETIGKLLTEVISGEEGVLSKLTGEMQISKEEIVDQHSLTSLKVDDENNEREHEVKSSNLDIENDTNSNIETPSAAEVNLDLEESDESKLTLSDKSNESFIVYDINDESVQKPDVALEETQTSFKEVEGKGVSVEPEVTHDDISEKDRSIGEEVEEESGSRESKLLLSDWGYGVLPKSRSEQDESDPNDTDIPLSKEEVFYEEKEHDSLSSATGGSSSDLSEQIVLSNKDKDSEGTKSNRSNEDISDKSKSKSDSEELVPRDIAIDVKKRVYEILADSNLSRGDKSPRLQDLYVTTYDLISPANSPERAPSSPIETKLVSSIFDSEAEEILRKQLAVEEEIKAITEQQQKEQLPLMYIREIPNKPPPPYTPPSSLSTTPVITIIPTSDEIEEITMYSAKILHKAYLSKNLANVSISNNTLSLISKDIYKDCYKFGFDLCKDIARNHYKQLEEDNSPSWLRVPKKVELTLVKPLDTDSLKVHLIRKLKETLGYQKLARRENTIIKWSRKKRDHVDEILVMECQQEEAQWTNYQKDELLVKDQITNQIFDSLLTDTAQVFAELFSDAN